MNTQGIWNQLLLSMKTLHFHTVDFIQNRLRFLAGAKFTYIN